ncbi:MAG: hypothetical protein QGG14_05570 [Planctomycetota bacterium]|nr:hypothetical protein [Planctomycetota bacterium]
MTSGFASDASGNTLAKLPIPNLPGPKGLPFYFQAYVVVAAANVGNALMTNGIAAISQ